MLEHQHANPILQVFVKLLIEIQDIKNKSKQCKIIAPFEEQCKEFVFFCFYQFKVLGKSKQNCQFPGDKNVCEKI